MRNQGKSVRDQTDLSSERAIDRNSAIEQTSLREKLSGNSVQ